MTDTEVKGAARSARRRCTPVQARLALAAALLGFFMICLDATAVNAARPQPSIRRAPARSDTAPAEMSRAANRTV